MDLVSEHWWVFESLNFVFSFSFGFGLEVIRFNLLQNFNFRKRVLFCLIEQQLINELFDLVESS